MTLYLWDLADTLFEHEWKPAISGFGSFDDYLKSIGLDINKLSAYEFENSHIDALKNGFFGGMPLDGFKEALEQTKNNYIFTTGNKEQLNTRAEFLEPKLGFDIRNLFQGIYSTFDFGSTNKKTEHMFQSITKDAISKGFTRIVYTDDNPTLRLLFLEAIKDINIESASFSSIKEMYNSEFHD